MENTRHSPQSPTHRSPELPHPSLTSFAQTYEPTAAQKFVQEQRERHSIGSSTSPSLFGSALSADSIPTGEPDEEEEEEDDDDGEEEEELRGYRRTPRGETTGDDERKNGSVGAIWQDYQPDYGMLNESYQTTKQNMYKEIELTLRHLQHLETRLDHSKEQFHGRIEKEYEDWSLHLDTQRHSLALAKQNIDAQAPKGKSNKTTKGGRTDFFFFFSISRVDGVS